MNTDLNLSELFERYLENDLTLRERKEFEQRLLTDRTFAERFRLHKEVYRALIDDDIKVGDGIITSGLGGVFPKGLVVGYVRSVQRERSGLFQTVEVEPAVDFSRLEEVLVVLKETP